MNESEFEKKLRTLAPAAPSAELLTRIEAELPKQASTGMPFLSPAFPPASNVARRAPKQPLIFELLHRLLYATAGAAIACVVLLNRDLPQTTARESSSHRAANISFVEAPARTVSELIEASDEGLVYDQESATPQRQVRHTYLERHFWTNPQTGAVIEYEVPREDIVLMPVAMQ